MTLFITVLHFVICVLLILLVILQKGKGGGELGGMFGGGSQTVFGPRGATTFLSKMTIVLAFSFFATSLYLVVDKKNEAKKTGWDPKTGQEIKLGNPESQKSETRPQISSETQLSKDLNKTSETLKSSESQIDQPETDSGVDIE